MTPYKKVGINLKFGLGLVLSLLFFIILPYFIILFYIILFDFILFDFI